MSFHEVSSGAEKILLQLLESKAPFSEGITLKGESSEVIRCNSSSADELEKNALVSTVSRYLTGDIWLLLSSKGKDYFNQKKKFEEEKRIALINISASDNSPVNVNTGNGQAIQNVSIYTAEQHNAINEFKEEVESSSLSLEHKAEVLELLESMEEAKAKNKSFTFKSMLNRINEIVTTSNTLHAIWQGITQLFS